MTAVLTGGTFGLFALDVMVPRLACYRGNVVIAAPHVVYLTLTSPPSPCLFPYPRYIGNGDPVIEMERAHVLFGAQTPVANGDVLK